MAAQLPLCRFAPALCLSLVVCGGGHAQEPDADADGWRIELAEKLEHLSGKPCLMTLREGYGGANLILGPFLQPVDGWHTPVAYFMPDDNSMPQWSTPPQGELGSNEHIRLFWTFRRPPDSEVTQWLRELELKPSVREGPPAFVQAESPEPLARHTPYIQLSFNACAGAVAKLQWPSFVLTLFTDTGECFYHRFERQSDTEPIVLRKVLQTGRLASIRTWLQNTAPWCVTYSRHDRAVWPRSTAGWLSFRTPQAIGQMPLPVELGKPVLALLTDLDKAFWDAEKGAQLPDDSSDWLTGMRRFTWKPTEEPKSLGRQVESGREYAFSFEGSRDPLVAWAEMCVMRPTHPESKPQFYLSDGRLRPGWRAEVIRPSTAHHVRLDDEEFGIAVNISHHFFAVIADPNERGREYRYLPPPPPTRAQVYCPVDARAKRIFNEPVYRVTPSYVERWEEAQRVPYVLIRNRLQLDTPVLVDYWDMKSKQKPAVVEIRVYDHARKAFRKFLPEKPIPPDGLEAAIAEAMDAVRATGGGYLSLDHRS